MTLTEREIFTQYDALRSTYDYMLANAERIRELYEKHQPQSLTFVGCGSGYCLCRGAETLTKLRLGLPANALAGGDLLVNFSHYKGLLKNTMLVAPSRSGGTSEVVLAVRKARELGVPVIGISAKVGAPLTELADLSLEIPWAFDDSVCQTRTVTNLHTANLLLIALLAGDEALVAEIGAAVKHGPEFMERYTPTAKEIAAATWKRAVVLADSELEGIAQEAAIAFTEIPQIPANYYHVLDVRHGPMVLIEENTLVVAALSPEEEKLQRDLVRDLKRRRAKVVTISSTGRDWGADWHVEVPPYQNYAVAGIPFIFIPQSIALYKALHRGLNPDLPDGLDPMIDLENND